MSKCFGNFLKDSVHCTFYHPSFSVSGHKSQDQFAKIGLANYAIYRKCEWAWLNDSKGILIVWINESDQIRIFSEHLILQEIYFGVFMCNSDILILVNNYLTSTFVQIHQSSSPELQVFQQMKFHLSSTDWQQYCLEFSIYFVKILSFSPP